MFEGDDGNVAEAPPPRWGLQTHNDPGSSARLTGSPQHRHHRRSDSPTPLGGSTNDPITPECTLPPVLSEKEIFSDSQNEDE